MDLFDALSRRRSIRRERLGHASLKEVDRYTHVLPHLQQKAVKAMEDLSL